MATARRLVCHDVSGHEPTQCDLRRAVSTVYYALFHHASWACADLLLAGGDTLSRAKYQVYRSIDHRQLMDACKKAKLRETEFPGHIADYASLLLNAYKARCKADYDPSSNGDFRLPQVLHKIGEAETAIERFEASDIAHRRAFAVLVAIRHPKGDRA